MVDAAFGHDKAVTKFYEQTLKASAEIACDCAIEWRIQLLGCEMWSAFTVVRN